MKKLKKYRSKIPKRRSLLSKNLENLYTKSPEKKKEHKITMKKEREAKYYRVLDKKKRLSKC